MKDKETDVLSENTPKNIYYGTTPPMYGVYGGDSGEYYGGNDEAATGIGDISFIRLLRLIRTKWITLVLMTLFGILCAVFYLWKTVPVYRATSLIEMRVRKPKILSRQGAVLDDSGYVPRVEVFNTRLAKFQSSRMREIAAEKYAQLCKANQSLTKDDCQNAVAVHVSFKLKKNTRLVTISCESTNKDTVAMVANAYALAAETIALEENKTSSENAVEWLKAQAAAHKKQLAKTEKELAEYRARNNIDILEGQKKSDEDAIAELNTTLAQLESKVVVLEEVLKLMDNQVQDISGAATLPADIPHKDRIVDALKEWQDAVQQRDLLLETYTEKHPKVIAINTRIDSLENRLLNELSSARAAVSNEVKLLNKQIEGLRNKIVAVRKKVDKSETAIVACRAQLTAMERERDVRDTTYRSILNRIEEARLSADEDTAIVKIIDEAKTPTRPIYPKRINVLFVGMVLGFLGGFVLAFITDTVEDHITSYTDIERVIGLKVLGLIPHAEKSERENLALATLDSKFGKVAEAMAGIRTVLSSPQYKKYTDSILVTSSVPAEGKTITACNLAIMSAKSGLSTLLIDFDMRRPKLSAIFGDPGKEHSLLHILNKRDTSLFSELPKYGKCEGLSVITSTPSSNISPAEIMGSRYVVDFVKWAQENYDRVIIDSPPFGIVGDAGVLACLVNSVILVCRPEISRRRGLKHIVQQLGNMGANIIGTIVNDIDFTKQGYFSNYYHYSYHNYHYNKYYHRDE